MAAELDRGAASFPPTDLCADDNMNIMGFTEGNEWSAEVDTLYLPKLESSSKFLDFDASDTAGSCVTGILFDVLFDGDSTGSEGYAAPFDDNANSTGQECLSEPFLLPGGASPEAQLLLCKPSGDSSTFLLDVFADSSEDDGNFSADTLTDVFEADFTLPDSPTVSDNIAADLVAYWSDIDPPASQSLGDASHMTSQASIQGSLSVTVGDSASKGMFDPPLCHTCLSCGAHTAVASGSSPRAAPSCQKSLFLPAGSPVHTKSRSRTVTKPRELPTTSAASDKEGVTGKPGRVCRKSETWLERIQAKSDDDTSSPPKRQRGESSRNRPGRSERGSRASRSVARLSDDDSKERSSTDTEGNRRRKQHNPWNMEETESLIIGVERCGGGRWADIKKLGFKAIERRSAVDLKDKWRNLMRVATVPVSAARTKCDKRREVPQELLDRVRSIANATMMKAADSDAR